jgi:hypothetical protein
MRFSCPNFTIVGYLLFSLTYLPGCAGSEATCVCTDVPSQHRVLADEMVARFKPRDENTLPPSVVATDYPSVIRFFEEQLIGYQILECRKYKHFLLLPLRVMEDQVPGEMRNLWNLVIVDIDSKKYFLFFAKS